MTLKKIVFIHPFLLHYHYPRLTALDEKCRATGISLFNIQLAGTIETYQSLINSLGGNFNNQCLFAERDFFKIPMKKMRSALREALEAIQPDVIFLYGYSLQIMVWAKLWAEKKQIASVVISDSNYFDKARFQPFELLKSLFILRFEAAFVGGESSSLYLKHLGFPEERITAGYDVVDNASIQSLNTRNMKNIPQIRKKWNLPERYFLFVGRLLKCKNIEGLIGSYIDYFRSVPSSPWNLVLCGGGPEGAKLREYVNGLDEQIARHITFYGLIKQHDIVNFYSGATCLVLPSESESWGLVVNEALACSLPVIVSNRCGCTMDLVRDDVNGWKFNPEKTGELTIRMLQMHYLDPSVRAKMGRNGKEIIAEWSLDRFCSNALKSATIAVEHVQHTHATRKRHL